MKMLLMLAVVLWAALSARPAEGAPAEAAVAQKEDKSATQTEEEAHAAVADLSKAHSSFCLDDWQYHSGSCYILFHFYDSWSNAESHCAEFDSSLTSVHNIWEYTFLQRMAKKAGHSFAWIGGYHFEDKWRWEDGSRLDYEKWSYCSDSHINQCLKLNSEAKIGWSNQHCNTAYPYICKRSSTC